MAQSIDNQRQFLQASEELEAVYELSPAQQGILFHTLYEDGVGLYSEQVSFTLTGELNRSAFTAAWNDVIKRHPSLRTSFHATGIAKPLQLVNKSVTLLLQEHDWCELSHVEQQQQLAQYLQSDREQGFDLSTPPLVRLTLFKLTRNSYRFVFTYHHLLVDGWSVAIVLREVLAFYKAYSANSKLSLPATRPYSDFLGWLQRQGLTQAGDYWRRLLKGFTFPTSLRVKWPHASQDLARYAVDQIKLSETLTKKLSITAQRYRLTQGTLVQGAWAVLLSHYSGTNDVVYGLTVAGRPVELEGVEDVVGLFINTLPVRATLDPRARVVDWLQQLQRQLMTTQKYQYSPLVDVQAWSDVERGQPLFRSIVIFEKFPVQNSSTEETGGLAISDVRYDTRTNYELTMMFVPGERMSLNIVYDQHQFVAWTIRSMLEHLETLLASIAAEPMQQLSALPVMTTAAREQVARWNKTEVEYSAGECLHELVAAQVERTPAAVAVIDGGEQVTYAELNRRANQLAHYLQVAGVGPEELVGICLGRSVSMVVAVLAVLKAGGAYVPLDPEYPRARVSYMLGDAEVRLVLTERAFSEGVRAAGVKVVELDEEGERLAAYSDEDPPNKASPENLAYVIYTSGSTGRPKGICIQHRSVGAFLRWVFGSFSAAELQGVLASTSICFDLSVFELFAPLARGGAAFVVDNLFQLETLALRERVTLVNTVPSLMRELIKMNAVPRSVRTINLAGEQLKPELVSEVFQATDAMRLLNLYGPTEATTYSTCHSVLRNNEGPPNIGRPISNTRIQILDDRGNVVPLGVEGELYIGGEGLARGYLRRYELTAEKFVPDPLGGPGGRLFRTGDLGRYLPNGEIEFIGRVDEQVKIRGFRIELGEIENVLQTCPLVREAVVLTGAEEEEKQQLVAYVVVKEDAPPANIYGELRNHLQAQLPVWMMPNVICTLDALPLTPNGKVDRTALRALPLDLAKGPGSLATATPVEEILSEIWAEVMQVDHVGTTDDFFSLGGHSLLAMQIVSRIREAFQIDLPIRHIFEGRTIMALAPEISAALASDSLLPPIYRIPRTGQDLPTSYAQERFWFLDQLEPANASYNVPVAVQLTGVLNRKTLEEAVTEIVHRHEILRTNFSEREGRPVQVIGPATTVGIPTIDLTGLPKEQRQREVIRLAIQNSRRPFNLSTDHLWRLTLLKLDECEHVLMLTAHHIIYDGWSTGVFLRELGALYEAFSAGKPSPLPELAIQYADFASWQRQALSGELRATLLSYWERQLAGVPTVLELPTNGRRSTTPSFEGEVERWALSEALTAQLKKLGRSQGATLFMTLLAAFNLLLSRYTQQDEVSVATPVAGRNSRELEGLIGLFVNTLILRTNLSGDPTFVELLKRVREVTLGAYAHQELPFEQVVRKLDRTADPSSNPHFQVMFFLQNAPMPPLQLSHLSLTPLQLHNHTSMFDLSVFLVETKKKLIIVAEYRTDLFDRLDIQMLLAKFQLVLESVVAGPTRRISDFDIELPVENELDYLLPIEFDL